MTLLQRLSLAASISSATFSIASSIPQNVNKTIQPENVVRCEPNAGCLNQTLFGRSYKVINTPRFTVMVSITNEGVYTRADVSIANHTDTPLSMTPEDFRVEVVTPKPKVLLYVPPAHLVLPPPPPPAAAAPAPQPAAASSFVPQSAALTSPAAASANPFVGEADPDAAEAREKEAADKAAAEKPLSASSIAPNEVTRGRVYFARDKKSDQVNVVIPIAGLVFEFPYAMKH